MGPTDYRLKELADAAKVRTCHIFHLIHWLAGGNPVEAFAAFAQLEARHVEAMVVALRSSGLYPEGQTSKRRVRTASPSQGIARASRLPPAMQLPDDWLAYAQERRRWDVATTEDVLADFIEHWSNRTDARAAKIDWAKTWQTWVRRDRRPDGTWSPNGPLTPERHRETMFSTIALYRRLGRDTEADEIERSFK